MVGSGFDPRTIRAAYDAVADEYAVAFGDDLTRLELDRRLLDAVGREVGGRGRVLDIGCGPAPVSRYLGARGVDVVGVDFAPAMLAAARKRAPGLPLLAADLRDLPVQAGAVAGVTAFYVLQHVPRSELPHVAREFRRVLAPGGVLLVVAHAGEGEFQPAPEITATRYRAEELLAHLAAASFAAASVHHREPLPHEHQGERCYVMARAV